MINIKHICKHCYEKTKRNKNKPRKNVTGWLSTLTTERVEHTLTVKSNATNVLVVVGTRSNNAR